MIQAQNCVPWEFASAAQAQHQNIIFCLALYGQSDPAGRGVWWPRWCISIPALSSHTSVCTIRSVSASFCVMRCRGWHSVTQHVLVKQINACNRSWSRGHKRQRQIHRETEAVLPAIGDTETWKNLKEDYLFSRLPPACDTNPSR